MEIAGFVLSLVQCISPSAAEHWKYYRDLKVHMSTLKEELQLLNGRKDDIQNSAIEGETELKSQVKTWLERVEKINREVNNMEEEVKTVNYFSRRRLGKQAFLKIQDIKDLRDSNFPDGLVIAIPRRGEVLPTTSTLGGETTFKRKMEEIQACLMDDEARKIGVYGMGGIGKTTALERINNSLLRANKFDQVIWITVSKESDVIKLQNKIARKLGDDFCKELSENNDEQTRRAMLFGKLMRMRFLLILDDLWNVHPLETVGIPEPTAQNGCKLVLTTRSHHICCQMSCEPIIKMELLSETEASELFFDIVDRNLLAIPGLREIMEKVVQECARLPLAIVTVANSLKNTDDCNKWELALADLEEHISDPESVEKILKILKFSYDRLNDKNEQDCLLYCALYSEDYPIERNLLIDQLIAKGMVEKSKKSQRKDKKIKRLRMKKCQIMLDNLVKVCLLNRTTNDENAACLKMHDLIRDMALQIMRSNDNNSPRFLVEAGEGLMYIPDKEDWKENLLEVSLMANNISEIPLDLEPPNCPLVLTMFLNDNRHLRSIPGNFFLHMKGLTVLNLSNTSIDKLPESVSDLVNLGVLSLNRCESLQHVPSLAKLINLRRLDLGGTDVNEVPHGLEMLIKLRYLDLSVNRLSWVSGGVLCKFVHLRYLSLLRDLETPGVREEDLRQLRKLECLYCALYDLDSYNAYVRSLEAGAPKYYLQLGWSSSKKAYGENFRESRVVCLRECKISKSVATGGDCPLLLPANIEVLRIRRCHFNVSNLCELSSFENVTNLKDYRINDCAEIEHLFSYSSNIISLFQRVEILYLERVWNLRGLIRREEGSPSVLPLPRGTFSSLKLLSLCRCNKIKRLFLNGPLPNLERIVVFGCEQLVEIISTTYDEDEENRNERRESTTDHAIIDTPKLLELHLSNLPELQSIPMKSDSLQDVIIQKCPKLKKIPPIDRETCPPSLRSVRINKDLWDSLEWDYPNAKDFIKSMIDRTLSEESESECDN